MCYLSENDPEVCYLVYYLSVVSRMMSVCSVFFFCVTTTKHDFMVLWKLNYNFTKQFLNQECYFICFFHNNII